MKMKYCILYLAPWGALFISNLFEVGGGEA